MAKNNQADHKSIAILIYSLSDGGAERFVSYFLNYLWKLGIRVTLILMENNIYYEIPKDIPVYHLGSSTINESGILKLIKLPILAFRYARLIKKIGASHSFSLLTRPNLINVISKLLFRNKAKIILSERAYPTAQYGYRDIQSKINKYLISNLYPKAEHIIGNSQGNSEDLIHNFKVPSNKITTISNPIDISAISKISPIEDQFEKDCFNLITIGRLDKGKNHQMLIDAVANVSGVRLYIIGKGPLREELEAQIKNLNLQNKVFLLGYQANPFQYLKSADLFVFGSNHEGFPNVILEAMACDLPILSTNCPSGPSEILQLKEVKEDELMFTEYGILIPVERGDLMKAGIEYFKDHPNFLKSCKANLKSRISDYALDHILEEYIDVILDTNVRH